jgi:hypothetical protein
MDIETRLVFLKIEGIKIHELIFEPFQTDFRCFLGAIYK